MIASLTGLTICLRSEQNYGRKKRNGNDVNSILFESANFFTNEKLLFDQIKAPNKSATSNAPHIMFAAS